MRFFIKPEHDGFSTMDHSGLWTNEKRRDIEASGYRETTEVEYPHCTTNNKSWA